MEPLTAATYSETARRRSRSPSDYVPEPEARINLYARLARLRDPAQLGDLADEIEERFGPTPAATANLIAIKRLAETAAALGISRIDAGPHGVALKTSRHLCDDSWRRTGDRYFVEQTIEKEERIAAVSRLLEEIG
jgi:transcription-repair coupling factor (superfamily II helicase)